MYAKSVKIRHFSHSDSFSPTNTLLSLSPRSFTVDVELQSARCLFGEKVKELSVAVAKVDALTRQLEELRNGNTSNSYHVVSGNTSNSLKVSQEYEKLRKELLVSFLQSLPPVSFLLTDSVTFSSTETS